LKPERASIHKKEVYDGYKQFKIEIYPGHHAKQRPDAANLAGQFIREWHQEHLKLKGQKTEPSEMPPAICFSRKIGGGALEISDFLSEKLYYRVVDREQRVFFKKAFWKKDASPYEFDLVINSDFITEPRAAAEIVAQAFKEKFAAESEGKPFADRTAA